MSTSTQIQTIEPSEVQKLTESGQGIDLIDVRTPVEFREVHAQGARNVPLDKLNPTELLQDRPKDAGPLFFICRSGSRGEKACDAMIAAGCSEVVNVLGGTLAWDKVGLPVVRGKKSISLERQVRITAGSIVLISVVLSWVLQMPAVAGVAAFIGAGLVFAGITDTCGMGMMLAKMPWNQVRVTCDAGQP